MRGFAALNGPAPEFGWKKSERLGEVPRKSARLGEEKEKQPRAFPELALSTL